MPEASEEVGILHEAIIRKDKEIEKLRKENTTLLAVLCKQKEEYLKLKAETEKRLEKNK